MEQDTVESWDKALTEFDVYIWPIFKSYGYSKDFAYLIWNLNIMKNAIDEINDNGEGWQK